VNFIPKIIKYFQHIQHIQHFYIRNQSSNFILLIKEKLSITTIYGIFHNSKDYSFLGANSTQNKNCWRLQFHMKIFNF